MGTLLGIAALAVPGVSPLVAAGAIASMAVPDAAITGAAVGAVAGVLNDQGITRTMMYVLKAGATKAVSLCLSTQAVPPFRPTKLPKFVPSRGHSTGRTKMAPAM